MKKTRTKRGKEQETVRVRLTIPRRLVPAIAERARRLGCTYAEAVLHALRESVEDLSVR